MTIWKAEEVRPRTWTRDQSGQDGRLRVDLGGVCVSVSSHPGQDHGGNQEGSGPASDPEPQFSTFSAQRASHHSEWKQACV